MNIDLSTSLIVATGPGGSGKSNFFRWLFTLPPYRRHIIFDSQREFPPEDYNVYRPDNLEYEGGNEELNWLIGKWLSWPRHLRPRYFHVADAANFIPGGNKTVGSNVAQLIQQNTHIYPGITLSASARKPQNLDTDLRELADHWFIFGARGKSTWRELNEIAEGVEEAVRGKEEYEFIHIGPQGNLTKFSPVPDMGDFGYR